MATNDNNDNQIDNRTSGYNSQIEVNTDWEKFIFRGTDLAKTKYFSPRSGPTETKKNTEVGVDRNQGNRKPQNDIGSANFQ